MDSMQLYLTGRHQARNNLLAMVYMRHRNRGLYLEYGILRNLRISNSVYNQRPICGANTLPTNRNWQSNLAMYSSRKSLHLSVKLTHSFSLLIQRRGEERELSVEH